MSEKKKISNMSSSKKERAEESLPPRIHHPERLTGKGRMRQFIRYLVKTFKFPQLAESIIRDKRRSPQYSGALCVMLVIIMLALRYRSFNAFEPRLKDKVMKKLLGNRPLPKCIDTVSGALEEMELSSMEQLHQVLLKQAAKNKALRQTLHRGLRFFGFDGFEPVRSRKRSCQSCSTATYATNEGEVTDYFHRFVFLYSIGPQPQLLLGVKEQARLVTQQETLSEAVKTEGELTAVKPLINRLRKMFPKMFHVGIGDALYPNGPMFNFMKDGTPSYDLIAILKKENNEPMADAITIFSCEKPSLLYYDDKRKEHIRMWDSEGFETLESSDYPLRVIRAEVYKGLPTLNPNDIDWESKKITRWWMATTISMEELSGPEVFDAQRRRWDEENVFGQLTQHWNIKHVYLHHEVGTTAMMYAFMMAFNLFQLFLYRCMHSFATHTLTALAVVKEMELDYPQIKDARYGFFGAEFC